MPYWFGIFTSRQHALMYRCRCKQGEQGTCWPILTFQVGKTVRNEFDQNLLAQPLVLTARIFFLSDGGLELKKKCCCSCSQNLDVSAEIVKVELITGRFSTRSCIPGQIHFNLTLPSWNQPLQDKGTSGILVCSYRYLHLDRNGQFIIGFYFKR